MAASRLFAPVLGALRDVEGVHGSFVLSNAGQLLAVDLPPGFDEGLFATVGPRVVRFYDALTSGGEPIKHVVMRFARHKLQVRPAADAFLCVLCDLETNAAALGMAMALASRGLPQALTGETAGPTTPRPLALDATALSTPLSATLTSGVPEAEPSAAPATARPPITYRGRRLG